MNLDLATLQVLILALPGFVWTRFSSSLSGKKRPAVAEEIISALIYGVLTYLCLYLAYLLLDLPFRMSKFGTADWRFQDVIGEILFSLPLAICLAAILLIAKRRQFPLKLFRWLGITNFSGDADIWDYCFSEFRENGCYVNVRDTENNWIIQGFTRGYSERQDLRELILDNVNVFNDRGEFLFSNSAMYLGRNPDNVSIDFYDVEGSSNGEKSSILREKISDRWQAHNERKAGRA